MTAVFNSDQGAQFTSATFTNVLERKKLVIRMDGRGRVFDNIFANDYGLTSSTKTCI
jgi:transposase InsO family protein